ncbi:O-antigen ligase family protein [Bacteroidota bacterium]
MIELIQNILPYLILLFFVVKAIKEPIYFLAIPFLMFMSRSIFFDDVKLLRIPGRLVGPILTLFWFFSFWILSKINLERKSDTISKIRSFTHLDYCITGLILISCFGLIMTIIHFQDLSNVFEEFTNIISLFICYFFIKDLVSYIKPEILVKFLYSIVIVNSIASFLFVLHQGLHIKIYQHIEYLTVIYQGQEITRSFWFMPQFLPFSIAYLVVFQKNFFSVTTILLIVNLLAVFVSYTRSSLITAFLIISLYYIFMGLKELSFSLVIKNFLIYSIGTILIFLFVSYFLPANTNYFVNRFAEISDQSTFKENNSSKYRFMMTGNVISKMDDDKKILGMGPITEIQMTRVIQMRQTTADMVWTEVIFRWGYVGLFLFSLLYILSLTGSLKLFFKSQGLLANLSILLFLILISQIIGSFFSWTFLSGHGFAIGLWYFAILSSLLVSNNNSQIQKNLQLSDETA